MRPARLSPSAVTEWLRDHSNWESSGDAIARTFSFKGYPEALGFVVTLGAHAQKVDHHPELTLSWGKVSITLSTHDAGGVTQLDLDFAATADAFFGSAR